MKILAIGAHFDDIEIGCGGTLVKHIRQGDTVQMAVTSADEHRTGDINTRWVEQVESAKILGLEPWSINQFSYKDEVHDVVGILDQLDPDLIFVHHEFDTHQDHRRASIIGQAVGRKREITTLFYDSGSSYDFSANVYSIINYPQKLRMMRCYKSQIELGAVNIDILKKKSSYLASLITSQKHTFAEGFISRKMKWII